MVAVGGIHRPVALCLGVLLLLSSHTTASVAAADASPPPDDESTTRPDLLDSHTLDNARLAACRNDPTWQSVDYDECGELTGWHPRDRWWRHDPDETAFWMNGNEANLTACLATIVQETPGLDVEARYVERYGWKSCVISTAPHP
jgi:hypothetical protein